MPTSSDLIEQTDFASSLARFKAHIPASARWGEPFLMMTGYEPTPETGDTEFSEVAVMKGLFKPVDIMARQMSFEHGQIEIVTCEGEEVGFRYIFTDVLSPETGEFLTVTENTYKSGYADIVFVTGFVYPDSQEIDRLQQDCISAEEYAAGARMIVGVFRPETRSKTRSGLEPVVLNGEAYTKNRFELLNRGATLDDLNYELCRAFVPGMQ